MLNICKILCAFLIMAPVDQASSSEKQSPEEALEAYVVGLRTGNLAKLQGLFLPDGQFCLNDESRDEVVCKQFNKVLESWVQKPDPSASGRVIDRKDAAQTMTAITYELKFGGKTYVDQLLLYKVGNRWRIVAKTTFVR